MPNARSALIVVLLALAGCATPPPTAMRFATGLPVDVGLADSTLNSAGSGQEIDVVRFALGPVWETDSGDGATFDLGLLVTGTEVIGGQDGGPGLGGEIMLRPRIDMGWWEPYVVASIGAEYYTERVGIQGTNWGFPITVGLGCRFEIDDEWWFTADLRVFHESNGTGVLGHDQGPNPGFNDDLLYLGIERKF